MAEGWARSLKSDSIEPYSAGMEAHGLNPLAIEVMSEVGIDISSHRSKRIEELREVNFDKVVTVCGDADKHCPSYFNQEIVYHCSFDDPPRLAKSSKSKEEALTHYRRVRDEIRQFLEVFLESI